MHVYGKEKLLTGQAETFDVLEATIENYKTAYRKQWDGLPEDYKLRMAQRHRRLRDRCDRPTGEEKVEPEQSGDGKKEHHRFAVRQR